ncbi:MAG: YegP family protein [Segetibacter sp.]
MIRLHSSTNGQFYFVVTAASNGKVLMTSENYTRRANAIKGIFALAETLMWVLGYDTEEIKEIEFVDGTKK